MIYRQVLVRHKLASSITACAFDLDALLPLIIRIICHRCVESKPKARTSQKGARIAQAKLLYGDSSNSNALAMVVRANMAYQEQSRPRTPSATEVLMVASIDAGLLLNELVPAVAKLKMCVDERCPYFKPLH